MKYLLIFLFSVLTCTTRAQDTALLAVHYTFTHLIDSTMPDRPHIEKMVLQVAKNRSIYMSKDVAESDASRKEMLAAAMETAKAQGTVPVIDMTRTRRATRDKIVRDFNTRLNEVIIVSNFQQVDYLIKDDTGIIDWAFTDEVKKIMGLTCQKATGPFRGRIYEVWFSLELPYSTGPWKLFGLPGLIVEAADSQGQVQFTLDKIEDIRSGNTVISLPAAGVATTAVDFNKMVSSYVNAFTGGAAGADTRIKPVSRGMSNPIVPKPNNPIERLSKEARQADR